MAKSREINMNLLSVDDLFTTQEERDQKNQEYVKNISIYEITDFPNHPFKVKMDDKMLETIESDQEKNAFVVEESDIQDEDHTEHEDLQDHQDNESQDSSDAKQQIDLLLGLV